MSVSFFMISQIPLMVEPHGALTTGKVTDVRVRHFVIVQLFLDQETFITKIAGERFIVDTMHSLNV